MLARLLGNTFKSIPISRDAAIVILVSVVLSLIALVAFVATLPT